MWSGYYICGIYSNVLHTTFKTETNTITCVDPESLVKEGPAQTMSFFLLLFLTDKGERESKYHQKRAHGGPTLNAGLVSADPDQYCQETLYFVIFQGGPHPLPLCIRA